MTNTKLPPIVRSIVYFVGGSIFGVNFSEILHPLEHFETWNDFFGRKVIPRPIDKTEFSLVSPADSILLKIQEVKSDETILIKDIKYSLGNYLTGIYGHKFKKEEIQKLKQKKNTKLFSLLFYLSPKDYHRYHSMANCTILERVHIGGLLYPVKDTYINRVTV